jgi:hypothetical protein
VAGMFPARIEQLRPRAMLSAAGLIAGLLGVGCATQPRVIAPQPQQVTIDYSPQPELVAPRDAWTLAEAFVAAHPGSEILVGSGNSMLPLYPDRTVLVVQSMDMSNLKRGMTVVFIGDKGRPVAHALIEKTPAGWIAMGSGNTEPDRTRVQHQNYIGTVVRAFSPSAAVASRTAGMKDLPAGTRLAQADIPPGAALFAATTPNTE